jgi:hypothetical protein
MDLAILDAFIDRRPYCHVRWRKVVLRPDPKDD